MLIRNFISGSIIFLLLSNSIVFGQGVFVDAACEKKVTAGEIFTINLKIDKGDVKGFAKLELDLPYGFDPEPIEKQMSTFIVKNGKVKFIWTELPRGNTFNIKLKVRVSKYASGEIVIPATFFYIKDNAKQKYNIKTLNILVANDKEDMVAKGLKLYEAYQDKTISEPVSEHNQEIFFRIQVAAFSKKVSRDYLKEVFPYPDKVISEWHGGLYKYLIGDFLTYEDAKEFKNHIGIHGTFIIAYEKTKRIDIHDAIMKTR